MQMLIVFRWLTAFCVWSVLAVGWNVNPTVGQALHAPHSMNLGYYRPGLGTVRGSLKSASLIAINTNRGALQSWPIDPRGGHHPYILSESLGLTAGGSMVGDGDVVAITTQYPPGVIVYNVKTRQEERLTDPFGVPIDIAIDKRETLYVVDVNASKHASVTMYAGTSREPQQLVCKALDLGESIAVDDEGDIFIHGYGPGNFAGVAVIPNSWRGPDPEHCMQLRLKNEPGYVAGLAVDPKTDDLIVLDNPDFCAGGIEGRMTIYHKPYEAKTGVSHDLGANCAGSLRLNAQSNIVFVVDQDVSGSFTFILQRSYPDGENMGTYTGGNPGGITTIPNALPN